MSLVLGNIETLCSGGLIETEGRPCVFLTGRGCLERNSIVGFGLHSIRGMRLNGLTSLCAISLRLGMAEFGGLVFFQQKTLLVL